MPNVVVVGAQWGDEGKGKIVDLYTAEADVVVRFQGGNNAGHTLVVGGEKTVLHLVPSGILHAGKFCVSGNGCVVDPGVLVGEIDKLLQKGVFVDGRLLLSEQAHVILPWHRTIDALSEGQAGAGKIGTTGRGIGPTYEDKIGRRGVRIYELVRPEKLEAALQKSAAHAAARLQALGGPPPDVAAALAQYTPLGARLRPFARETGGWLAQKIREGARVLFEGAQGTLLDVDHGTYPFVTSSNTVAANAAIGSGVGPGDLGRVVGLAKAYATRVGSGPFPTELTDALGEKLREIGQEYGATTGRPRRCGWFDAVALRYAARVNGLWGLALTKLDVLTGLGELKIATAYELDGVTLQEVPIDGDELGRCRPVFETLPGWTKPLGDCRSFHDLPEEARGYVTRLEELTGVPIAAVSVGADREQTIQRRRPFA